MTRERGGQSGEKQSAESTRRVVLGASREAAAPQFRSTKKCSEICISPWVKKIWYKSEGMI